MINIHDIRAQFPILNQSINHQDLVYLDNAASSQKPLVVIEAWNDYYKNYNANVHRGIHYLSQIATDAMEAARKKIQCFINAQYDHEIVFTKGTTEGINLLAFALTKNIKKGDEIMISYLEHHSNIVPWQMLCQRTGAVLKVIPMNEKGELELDFLDKNLSEKTKILSVNHISNALGVINPIAEIISKTRQHSAAIIIIDAAQSIVHKSIDVQAMDCDFLVFSGHKMYAPMGTGVVYGKTQKWDELEAFHGGGEMIDICTFEKTTYAAMPFRFEAGTPNVGGNIALGAAIDFMLSVGLKNIEMHEQNLLNYAQTQLLKIEGLRIYAEKAQRAGVVSFNLEGVGIASDVGMILDKMGVAVRTGNHCTQPIMKFFNIAGTVRASFAVYNTMEEIDVLVNAVEKAKKMLN